MEKQTKPKSRKKIVILAVAFVALFAAGTVKTCACGPKIAIYKQVIEGAASLVGSKFKFERPDP